MRAADQGDERAMKRIAAIRAAASGGARNTAPSPSKQSNGGTAEKEKPKPKRFGLF